MRRRGFTLVELVLAVGLAAILFVALVRLIDTSITIWDRTESSRETNETASAALELLVEDLVSLEGGPRGDLLAEWVRFDVDGDGIAGFLAPRLRLIRQVSAADLLRLDAESELDPGASGLVEVAWTCLSLGGEARDARNTLVLRRGERRLGEDETLSFFDARFFGPSGRGAAGALEEVTGGVLWFSLSFAGQTSVLENGWRVGDGLADCAASWDAWNRGRPDIQVTEWNEPAAGQPPAHDVPLLPRRVRIEFELERAASARLRTRLERAMEPDETRLEVQNERALPEPGTLVLLDEEWMEIQSKSGTTASVARAMRGSRRAPHASGTLVHFGERILREVPIPLHKDDWDLR